jgi:hypothetical protein
VFDLKTEVELGVWTGGDETEIAELSLLFCSFIAAAAADRPSADENSDGCTLSLS